MNGVEDQDYTVPLAVGSNVITVEATAQDGQTTETYTVTVTRAGSGDAALSGLSLSGVTLSPTFAAGTTGYTASVGNGGDGDDGDDDSGRGRGVRGEGERC